MSETGDDGPPVLYIVARYLAQFGGEQMRDACACEISWPEMLTVAKDC